MDKAKLLGCMIAALACAGCSDNKAQSSTTQLSSDVSQVPKSPSKKKLTEEALEKQIGCQTGVEPRKAVMAMLKNKMIVETGDGWDGADYYRPTGSMTVFGFQVVKITGWDQSIFAGKDIFWYAGSGTAPPTFLEVRVAAQPNDVRESLVKFGLSADIVGEMQDDAEVGTTILRCYE